MKNYKITLLLSLFLTVSLFAQEEEEPVNLNSINNKKHEFRIDALEGLALPALDLSYEYVINKYSGVGASVSFAFDGDNSADFPQNFSFSPFFRQYFFNKKDYGARGFFAEGLLQFATGEGQLFDLETEELEDWSQFGVGVTLGWKFVSTNGFVIDIHLGGGRYLGDTENGPGGFARVGVNLGYRF